MNRNDIVSATKQVSKTTFVMLSVVAFVFAVACEKNDEIVVGPVAESLPNILLIIADDIGLEATPGYDIGNIKPNMPNVQHLASQGITFDNVWSYPVCSPTRSSILTGRYGYRTGVLNANDNSTIPVTEKTIQSFLDENTSKAYSHAIIGKWHLSENEPNRPTQMGVDYYAGTLGGGVANYNKWPLTENGESNSYSGYITTKLTDLAINWINQQDKPWFCWMAYTAPHTPFHLPPDNMHSQGSLPGDQASIDANPLPYFMATIESLDFEIGRLLENIPVDELDNTVVIFVGDNGTHPLVIQAPYQNDQSKGSLYQGGILVPMIISGKGVTRINKRDDNLIQTTDFFSTVAEIAGVTLPIYEDSYSFNSLLTSSIKGQRTYNYSEILDSNPNKSGYTIRDKQYKLMVLDNGSRRLYDLSSDPSEQYNLRLSDLTPEQETIEQELLNEAMQIRQ